jgi:hypothetical protein
MLTWDRFHNNNEDEWFIRPDGFAFTAATGSFCILLTSDPGTDTKEIQLTSDNGTDTHCAQLTTTNS